MDMNFSKESIILTGYGHEDQLKGNSMRNEDTG